MPVVGNNQECAVKIFQSFNKGFPAFKVKMVGGFVKDKEIAAG